MAISPRQRQLRETLAACTTVAEARAAIEAFGPRARADWAHIAKSLRVFDEALVDALFEHFEAIAYLGRNRAVPVPLRERLYLKLATDLGHPAVWGTLTAAAARGRIRYGDAVCDALLAQARPGPDGEPGRHWYTAIEVLAPVRGLPAEVRHELALAGVRASISHGVPMILAGKRGAFVSEIPLAAFERTVRVLLATHVSAAATLLREATPEQIGTLTRHDIAPLCRAREPWINDVVLQVIGHVRVAGDPSISAPA